MATDPSMWLNAKSTAKLHRKIFSLSMEPFVLLTSIEESVCLNATKWQYSTEPMTMRTRSVSKTGCMWDSRDRLSATEETVGMYSEKISSFSLDFPRIHYGI